MNYLTIFCLCLAGLITVSYGHHDIPEALKNLYEENCYYMDKISLLHNLDTQYSGICWIHTTYDLVSLDDEGVKYHLQFEKTEIKIFTLRYRLIEFWVMQGETDKWQSISGLFESINDGINFYKAVISPKRQNISPVKEMHQFWIENPLPTQRRPRANKVSNIRICNERFHNWTIITIKKFNLETRNDDPQFVYKNGDFQLSEVKNKCVVWFPENEVGYCYILEFDTENEARLFRDSYKYFAASTDNHEIPSVVMEYIELIESAIIRSGETTTV